MFLDLLRRLPDQHAYRALVYAVRSIFAGMIGYTRLKRVRIIVECIPKYHGNAGEGSVHRYDPINA